MALHLSQRCGNKSKRDVKTIHVEFTDKIIALLSEHIERLENATPEKLREEEEELKDRFSVLLAFTLQHGLEAVEIANALPSTVSTIHRWASGAFVPKQFFVHVAALKGVLELLKSQKAEIEAELLAVSAAQKPFEHELIANKYGHFSPQPSKNKLLS
jgi:hypothetical protein